MAEINPLVSGNGSEEEAGTPPPAGTPTPHRVRTLGRLSLIGIMYFSVAGGPEGTETLVKTGGPIATFLGISLLGVVFAIPLALMTAELSTMYPENGGFVLWAKAAFGDGAGRMAGWLQFCSSAVDTALYPGLFLTYVSQTMHTEFSWGVQLLIKGTFVVAITALNLAGIDYVGHGSTAMMFFLLAPFCLISLICLTGMFTGETILGWPYNPSNLVETIPDPDWGQFVLVLIWNMGMWETASVCSGEVQDVAKEFPPALGITVVLVVLNYVLPIASFVGLQGDSTLYNNGFYITIMDTVGGPFWGRWLGVSQCVSAMGLFTNGIVKNAWMLCGMGEQGMLPIYFASRMSSTGSPLIAISLTQAVTIAMVLYGDFKAVLAVDMLLYSCSLLLEISSTIYLRHSQPDLARPYRIPFEGGWLFLFFAPSFAIVFFAFAMAQFNDLVTATGFIVAGMVLLEVLSWTKRQYPQWFVGVEEVQHIEHNDIFEEDPEEDDKAEVLEPYPTYHYQMEGTSLSSYQYHWAVDNDTRTLLPTERRGGL